MGTPRIFWFKARSRKLLFLHGSPAWVIQKTMPWLAEKLFKLSADERFIEYPYVHAVIGLGRKQKILDVGCCGSQLPVELASMGHEVYGIDVLEYPLEHPNLTSVQGDICRAPFPDGSFDVVTAISTLEHIGLGRWGDPLHEDGDKKAVEEIARILKPGGRAIFAIPFGKERTVVYWGRVPSYLLYNSASLKDVFSALTVEREEFWVKEAEQWQPTTREEAETVASTPTDVCSIAMLVMRRNAG